MNARILNRGTEPPKDGWYQIEVSGEHPAGKGRKQVIDAKALTAIVNRFAAEKAEAGENWAGLLVDADHLSHDLGKATEARAWVQDLRVKDGQLEARLDLTDLGEAAIRNKRYKFFSTEYDPEDLEDLGGGKVRPLRLAGLAFTNRPNNRGGRPISNRTGDEPDNPTPQTKTTMKSVAEKLGLPADADEAAILAKITSIMAENETMKTKDAEAQADLVMNRLGKRVPKEAQDHWRKQLIANRKETEELMERSFPEKKEGTERIHNRTGVTAPEPVEARDGREVDAGPDEEDVKKAAAIRNRAHTISREEKVPFSTAFARARAELS